MSLVWHSVCPNGREGVLKEEWTCSYLKELAHRFRGVSTFGHTDSEMSKTWAPAVEEKRIDLKVHPARRRAAVLIGLYQGTEGELRVILTRRSRTLSSHSGEVALPGGKRDEGDKDDTATALREAHEEIGLLPEQVRVVATLEPFLSKNLLGVVPVIGLLDDVKLFVPTPNPGEVDAIFDAPLEMFLKDEKHWYQDREWLGVKYRVHFFDYTTEKKENFLVWGLTASMLIRAASIIYQRRPDFLEVPADFEKIVSSAWGLGCNPVANPGSAQRKA